MRRMGLILEPTGWYSYQRFKPLCCVDAEPHPSGPCWLAFVPNDESEQVVPYEIGFIGYNHTFRNNGVRYQFLRRIVGPNLRRQRSYMNRNFRCLSRVMIRPEFRGRGYATEVVSRTLPMVGVRFIECLTYADLIKGVLVRCGFRPMGDVASGTCSYYLWDYENSILQKG